MIMPEYGRYLERFVQYIKTLPTREERTQAALALMNTMIVLNPINKDNQDYKRKIWDQLIIMADYDLDVTPIYPFPNKEDYERKPDKVPYDFNHIEKRHYGKFAERMAKKIKDYQGEEQEALILLVANLLKKNYLVWNKNSVDDATILKDLQQLAGEDVKIPDDLTLGNVKEVVHKIKHNQHQQNKQNKQNNKKNNKKRK